MSVRKLRWRTLFAADQAIHVARAGMSQARHWSRHGHDFYECFLVECGRAVHWLDGEEHMLAPGQLHWISPQHVHSFKPVAQSGFSLINVALTAVLVESFLRRHGPVVAATLDGWSVKQHRMQLLAQPQNDDFARLVHGLSVGGRQTLDAEFFLCALTRLLQLPAQQPQASSSPDWLRLALSVAAEPEHLQEGFPALVRLCGRTPEHVSRSFQKYLHQTPSSWLNAQRVERARLLLETGDASIQAIAFETGFDNLSHFHRIFKHHTGKTPARYRRLHQSVLF